MQIWVDADACPKVIKEILFRAAQRTRTRLTLVANQPISTPPSRLIKSIQVAAGFDVADHKIVQSLNPGDLVITADIPLAAEVIARGAQALNPRGTLYTEANIGEKLANRNLMSKLRDSGLISGGPAVLSQTDRQHFANQLDRLLAQKPSAKPAS